MGELSLFDAVGGYDKLKEVHKIFYDKLYEHPWLKHFFLDIDQEQIENQQTDFIAQAMGGPQKFCGRLPIPAHKHMNITEEMFDVRHRILEDSLIEAKVDEASRLRWLKIDASFRNGIVKKSLDECEKRYTTDEILDFPKEHYL